MTSPVNPPPFLRIPDALLKDRETRDYLQQLETIVFQLRQRSGGDVDLLTILDNISTNGSSAQVQFLQQQLDGLPEFTMDTTGFTMDSTEWTMDKVLA